jgi:hypothetical protein
MRYVHVCVCVCGLRCLRFSASAMCGKGVCHMRVFGQVLDAIYVCIYVCMYVCTHIYAHKRLS